MPRLLNPANKLAFMICLAEVYLNTRAACLLAESLLNAGQCFRSINLRLTLADEIQIWAIEDKDRLHKYKREVVPDGLGYGPSPRGPASLPRGAFAPEAGLSDGALEHAVEGLFNHSVRLAGFQVVGVSAE